MPALEENRNQFPLGINMEREGTCVMGEALAGLK